MINCNDITRDNIREYNPNWMKIPDQPYRILTTGDCGSGKINVLLNNVLATRYW